MPLPSSGPLSLANIQTEFGGTNPISLNEYYAGGALVPAGTSGTNGAVPSSGAISIFNFYGTTAVIPFGESSYTTAGTYSFVVPPGITSICAVAVGGGGLLANWRTSGGGGGALSYSNNIAVTPGETLTVIAGIGPVSTVRGVGANGGDSSISRGSTTLLLAKGGISVLTENVRTGVGGQASQGVGAVRYSGGNGFGNQASNGTFTGAGGGAAGYGGDGGQGGFYYNVGAGAVSTPGTAGQGGGGGGGGAGYINASSKGGGGVGILGQGASGAVGTNGSSSTRGGNGSGGFYGWTNTYDGGWYGGGGGTDNDAFNMSIGRRGGPGAVRIIWGTGKSYPFNAT